MRSCMFLTAVGILATLQFASAGVSSNLVRVDTVGHAKRSQPAMLQELASLLSSEATIVTPSDSDWVKERERYMQNVQPYVQFSVEVGSEDDVPIVVSS